jgi:hypothetical protein
LRRSERSRRKIKEVERECGRRRSFRKVVRGVEVVVRSRRDRRWLEGFVRFSQIESQPFEWS